MWFRVLIFLFLIIFFDVSDQAKHKEPVPYEQKDPPVKYDNPGYSRDRVKKAPFRPTLDLIWNDRFKKKFHPAWMDYCDPKHCDDYHKPACGLNRRTMRFKWFQSGCHIAIHNFCSIYRGTLKFDTINSTFCHIYVMYLRQSCPMMCEEDVQPVCAVSSIDNHVVLFKNECEVKRANCRKESMNEYEEVDMSICKYTYLYTKQAVD